jgi:hypothetical protein
MSERHRLPRPQRQASSESKTQEVFSGPHSRTGSSGIDALPSFDTSVQASPTRELIQSYSTGSLHFASPVVSMSPAVPPHTRVLHATVIKSQAKLPPYSSQMQYSPYIPTGEVKLPSPQKKPARGKSASGTRTHAKVAGLELVRPTSGFVRGANSSTDPDRLTQLSAMQVAMAAGGAGGTVSNYVEALLQKADDVQTAAAAFAGVSVPKPLARVAIQMGVEGDSSPLRPDSAAGSKSSRKANALALEPLSTPPATDVTVAAPLPSVPTSGLGTDINLSAISTYLTPQQAAAIKLYPQLLAQHVATQGLGLQSPSDALSGSSLPSLGHSDSAPGFQMDAASGANAGSAAGGEFDRALHFSPAGWKKTGGHNFSHAATEPTAATNESWDGRFGVPPVLLQGKKFREEGTFGIPPPVLPLPSHPLARKAGTAHFKVPAGKAEGELGDIREGVSSPARIVKWQQAVVGDEELSPGGHPKSPAQAKAEAALVISAIEKTGESSATTEAEQSEPDLASRTERAANAAATSESPEASHRAGREENASKDAVNAQKDEQQAAAAIPPSAAPHRAQGAAAEMRTAMIPGPTLHIPTQQGPAHYFQPEKSKQAASRKQQQHKGERTRGKSSRVGHATDEDADETGDDESLAALAGAHAGSLAQAVLDMHTQFSPAHPQRAQMTTSSAQISARIRAEAEAEDALASGSASAAAAATAALNHKAHHSVPPPSAPDWDISEYLEKALGPYLSYFAGAREKYNLPLPSPTTAKKNREASKNFEPVLEPRVGPLKLYRSALSLSLANAAFGPEDTLLPALPLDVENKLIDDLLLQDHWFLTHSAGTAAESKTRRRGEPKDSFAAQPDRDLVKNASAIGAVALAASGKATSKSGSESEIADEDHYSADEDQKDPTAAQEAQVMSVVPPFPPAALPSVYAGGDSAWGSTASFDVASFSPDLAALGLASSAAFAPLWTGPAATDTALYTPAAVLERADTEDLSEDAASRTSSKETEAAQEAADLAALASVLPDTRPLPSACARRTTLLRKFESSALPATVASELAPTRLETGPRSTTSNIMESLEAQVERNRAAEEFDAGGNPVFLAAAAPVVRAEDIIPPEEKTAPVWDHAPVSAGASLAAGIANVSQDQLSGAVFAPPPGGEAYPEALSAQPGLQNIAHAASMAVAAMVQAGQITTPAQQEQMVHSMMTLMLAAHQQQGAHTQFGEQIPVPNAHSFYAPDPNAAAAAAMFYAHAAAAPAAYGYSAAGPAPATAGINPAFLNAHYSDLVAKGWEQPPNAATEVREIRDEKTEQPVAPEVPPKSPAIAAAGSAGAATSSTSAASTTTSPPSRPAVPSKRPVGAPGAVLEDDATTAAVKKDLFAKCRNNRHGAVEDLFSTGVSVTTKDKHGNQTIHLAAQNGNKRMIKICLRWGADINAQNVKKRGKQRNQKNRESASRAAIYSRSLCFVQICLESVFSSQLQGNTPLHYCFAYQYDDLAAYLIEKGADDSKTNVFGMTCYDGLKPADREKAVELINSHAPHLSDEQKAAVLGEA